LYTNILLATNDPFLRKEADNPLYKKKPSFLYNYEI